METNFKLGTALQKLSAYQPTYKYVPRYTGCYNRIWFKLSRWITRIFFMYKMSSMNNFWEKLTSTEALINTSGAHESAFFSSVYRAVYMAGMSSEERNKWYKVYSSAIKLTLGLFLSSELWVLCSMPVSLDGLIDSISVTIIHLIAVCRYNSMKNNKEIYKKLATAMESSYFDTTTLKRQQILNYWIKTNDKYFKLLLTLGTCTLAVWYIYPLVDDLEYNLVVNLPLPFDYRSPGRYFITYAVVLIVFHYISYFVMVNDLILQAYLTHLLCQLSILGDCFENILSDCSVGVEGLNNNSLHLNEVFIRKYTERLNNLVEQHKFLLSNAMELRKVLSTPMLGQVAASGMLICFAAYQVTATINEGLAKFLMSLLYLSYNMFELFIFCLWCDEIKIQSEQIGLSVYRSGWQRGVATLPGVRSCLALVALRASRPVVLTAGSLYDLSLKSYTMLVKTSYSALTVLLRVRHNREN